jgi:DNA polymerase/3'-5' exonuclease PolX
MNMTAHIPHMIANALPIASKAVDKLKPFCTRIDIAGSIRRRMDVVKDIEIVCIPNSRDLWTTGNLFSQPAANGQQAANFSMAANSLGKVLKGNASGRYMNIQLLEGLNLDLFMTTEEDYFRQLAIRTGPADFSHKVIAVTWSKKGWCGTSFGLRRKNECIIEDDKWKLAIPNSIAEKPPVWKSEEEFFQWLGLAYTRPELR